METNDKKHFIEFKTSDNKGPVIIQIQKDCSQIRIEANDDDIFFDVNFRELVEIRNCLNKVIELNK